METQKTTNKYKNGKIYKIVCDTTNMTYIGSTIQGLSSRLSGHRADYKRYLNKKKYFISSYKILENNNYKIILIDNCPCNSKEELHKIERKYIESMDCINKCIPTQTKKEWKEKNKEKIKEYNKQYRENNKEQILEQKQEYYQNNKETQKKKVKEHYQKNKEKIKKRVKEYRENNKDKIKEQKKEYRENNKTKIKEQKKEYYKDKIECEYCKCIFRKNNLKRHQKSLKCKKFQLLVNED